MENNKPVKEFKAGMIKASVWENVKKKDNGEEYKTFSITLTKSYKVDEEWKTTNSFQYNEVPKAVIVMKEAYKFIATGEHKE